MAGGIRSSRPFGVRDSRLNGKFARNFFFVPVGGSASLRSFSPARGCARGEEQRRHQLRLTGAAVADNANVANVLGEIALHVDLRRARSVLNEKGAGLRLSELNNLRSAVLRFSPFHSKWETKQKIKLVRSAVNWPPLAANRADANTPNCMGQLLVRPCRCKMRMSGLSKVEM